VVGQAPAREDPSRKPSTPAPHPFGSGGGFIKHTVHVKDGIVIVGLKALLRLKIAILGAQGDPVGGILAGLRLRELESQLGYKWELYGFRVRGECVEAEGERFRTWCSDLAGLIKPDTISFEALELEGLLGGAPSASPDEVRAWVERLVELDAEMSRVDQELTGLLVKAGGLERAEDRRETLCLESLLTTEYSSRMLPLPSHAFNCAQRLEQLYSVRKWLGLLYINVDGKWVGEPDSVDVLQAVMKRSFERLALHEFNWKYSTFEREVLKVLYAGAPRAEPVRGVRAGDYIIVWDGGSYELRKYTGDFVIHDINARVRLELLEAAKAKGYNARQLAETESPGLVEILKAWVGEPYWLTLLEIVGYTTIAFKYPLHKAFMLLGRGSNGKSTYLRMLKDILGRGSVTSIPIQALTDLDYRFLWAGLIGKLANIFADLPRIPLSYTGVFKVLTGEDCIDIDRKGREPVRCYTNYAKLIFSANELPRTSDLTHAFFRRWVIIDFPNTFPEDPGWYDRSITPEVRDQALTVGLEAVREILERRAFTGETDVRERWIEETDPIFRFLRDLERLNLARRSPGDKVPEKALYEVYTEWARIQGVNILAKNVLTREIEKYGITKGGPGKKYYTGIMLLDRPDVVKAKLRELLEEGEGLEVYQ
jgi:P4 family phage/plasmid primase-like protien